MHIEIHSSKLELGRAAAAEGATAIRAAINRYGEATIILATGASQFEMLEALVDIDIDWSRVSAFHLDEYVGISASHPASFRRYLKERFLEKVGPLAAFEMIEGDADELEGEVARLNGLLEGRRVDVCFAGVGENCHLAFNDPPADFETEAAYIVVDLDEACRGQQFGEGWFQKLEDVPLQAISMSVKQIMASDKIVLSIADARKATAVRHAVEGPVDPAYPASIVQRHAAVSLHLDEAAAELLSKTRV